MSKEVTYIIIYLHIIKFGSNRPTKLLKERMIELICTGLRFKFPFCYFLTFISIFTITYENKYYRTINIVKVIVTFITNSCSL